MVPTFFPRYELTMRRIVPIVEGKSEDDSIPAFVRRVLNDLEVFDVEPDCSIREHRNRLVKHDVFLNRVRMAQLRDNCAAVLVIFDADDDAACRLGPELQQRAEASGLAVPCRVVMAVREIEAWLIAGIESIRGYRGVRADVSPPADPEAIRGAKELLDKRMERGYKETIDQVKLLHRFDYQAARRHAPSLDEFLREIDRLIEDVR